MLDQTRSNHPISDEPQGVIDGTLNPVRGRNPSKRLTWLFITAAFAIIIQLFYGTAFRTTLENYFFDIRIKWMPIDQSPSQVFVIRIDDESIQKLEPDPVRLRVDGKKRPYLSTAKLTKAASILANSEAKAIALLMPEHAFPATDIDLHELTLIAKYDQRMLIGTLGYNQLAPNLAKLPPAFEHIEDKVAGYETFRSRSNAIVRSLPFLSFRGLSEVENLPAKIATVADHAFATADESFIMKPKPIDHFPSISLADFLEQPTAWMSKLTNMVVIVGYTVNRDVGFQTTEPMMAHTPLTGFFPTLDNGISTTWIVANAVDNLLQGDTLRPAPAAVNLIQTTLVGLLCFFFWNWGSLIASLATVVCGLTLLTIHATSYSWLSVSIPLADTFLVAVLVTVIAAIRRLKIELMDMAEQQASTKAKSEIASVQGHFLTGFAAWLKTTTADIMTFMRESAEHIKTHPSRQPVAGIQSEDLYRRAFAAAEDFNEYLEAIHQIPELDSLQQQALIREPIVIHDLVNMILRRFLVKIESRNLKIIVDIDASAEVVKSSPHLLDAIVFNFISNAIKYGPDAGEITIRAVRSRAGNTTISVLDQGPGIAEEQRERIFDRFYRIGDARQHQVKGTGLGLFLCKYFAEGLGGHVELETEVGAGSEFRLVLPP